jgi:16S rRNA (guanine527-N7)-methyltransferase
VLAPADQQSSEAQEFVGLLNEHFAGALSPLQTSALYVHYAKLQQWNKILNLTAVGGLNETVVRHYCESLFLGRQLPEAPVAVLDFGSGAGFPGIPMAVLRPDCRFVLSESHQRKAVFLREATRHFANVSVLAVRAEQIRDTFDWVVSRAVKPRDVLKTARRIGSRLALLLGEADAQGLQTTPGVVWDSPLQLPWGKRRVLLCGDVVSRET